VPDYLGNFLTESEVSKIIRRSGVTLRQWRLKNLGPRWCKLGGRVLYPEADVHAWIHSRIQVTDRATNGVSDILPEQRPHQPFQYDGDSRRIMDDPQILPGLVTDESFIRLVMAEVSRARQKHPSEGNPLMAALTEEVGEVAKALLDEPWLRVVEEAVQVASTAMRLAVEGDSTVAEYRRRPR
jgi:predicted DNA-binding transcriptional regulator AlpA